MNYLGIDTSAYTTSLAIVNSSHQLVWESRRILDVPQGETGLAQSTAFFQHIQQLPVLVEDIPKNLWNDMAGVGVSIAPRPVKGSYMPVFTAGYSTAAAIAAARQIPLKKTTHQEGHLAAGIVSANISDEKRFLAVHLSGGTTELLSVEREEAGQLSIELLGGTTDLHAGQFIDRVGVLLGLPFPAGRYLEEMAANASPGAASLLPSSADGFNVSFSGVETAARRLLEKGCPQSDVARAVEGCVARTIFKLIKAGIEKFNINKVLIVGGVSSNRYIRSEIEHRLGNKGRLYWAEPEWSRDNAIGVAFLTKETLY